MIENETVLERLIKVTYFSYGKKFPKRKRLPFGRFGQGVHYAIKEI